MPSLPDVKITIYGLLEAFFDERLEPANVDAFNELDKSRAGELVEFYNEYVDRHSNFVLPRRKRGVERPFLWHEIGNGGLFGGGIETQLLMETLLLHDSVVATDPVRWIVSQNAQSTYNRALNQYRDVIKNLALVRPLVDAGHLTFASDSRAYEHTRPIKDRHDIEHKDIGFEYFCANNGVELPAYSRCIAYLQAADDFDADVFLSDSVKSGIVRQMFNYWNLAAEEQGLSLLNPSATIKLDVSGQTVSDLVKIRQDGQVFADFRQNVHRLLEDSSPDELSQNAIDISRQFNCEPGGIWSSGAQKKLSWGIAIAGVTTTATGLASPPTAALASAAANVALVASSKIIELVSERVQKRSASANRAAVNLFSSIATTQ